MSEADQCEWCGATEDLTWRAHGGMRLCKDLSACRERTCEHPDGLLVEDAEDTARRLRGLADSVFELEEEYRDAVRAIGALCDEVRRLRRRVAELESTQ